ncbi:PH domain-containing protein [Kurthia sibirica]|uniref:YdbS-like PH domain-containing protein n=1 Tax=Kurthia sibirica TaxID=202750 RepID=A0A2U3AK52_9BACL|nr:PH domain-containing protein [Kurthia sibirica]PWI24895.1 hypothetical protein DEX24_10800 [Kurthia sibirica]GEK33198.1 UPF0699 transmembrane protein YdbS [Kurthia sibirica]
MYTELKNQIDPAGLKVWRIQAMINAFIFLIVVIAVFVLTYFFDFYSWIQYTLLGIWIVNSFLTIYLFPKIRWNRWRYEVREEEIEIQSGLFVVERTLVPMVRVQHVETVQGPILKRYNLAIMSVSTAATIHMIPALRIEEADELRARISRLARVAEDDV